MCPTLSATTNKISEWAQNLFPHLFSHDWWCQTRVDLYRYWYHRVQQPLCVQPFKYNFSFTIGKNLKVRFARRSGGCRSKRSKEVVIRVGRGLKDYKKLNIFKGSTFSSLSRRLASKRSSERKRDRDVWGVLKLECYPSHEKPLLRPGTGQHLFSKSIIITVRESGYWRQQAASNITTTYMRSTILLSVIFIRYFEVKFQLSGKANFDCLLFNWRTLPNKCWSDSCCGTTFQIHCLPKTASQFAASEPWHDYLTLQGGKEWYPVCWPRLWARSPLFSFPASWSPPNTILFSCFYTPATFSIFTWIIGSFSFLVFLSFAATQHVLYCFCVCVSHPTDQLYTTKWNQTWPD